MNGVYFPPLVDVKAQGLLLWSQSSTKVEQSLPEVMHGFCVHSIGQYVFRTSSKLVNLLEALRP